MRQSFLQSTRAIAVAMLVLGATPTVASTRPNIVILLADDLGYGELGCQGNPEIPTPHIDSLARDGIRFTNGYVTAPYCSPSRAGLLTGRYQNRFGYERNIVGATNEDPRLGLPPSEITLAEHLRNVGYATALIGKWHLGGTAAYHPLRHGFDTFFGFLHEGHFYVPPLYTGTITMLRRRALPNGHSGRWIAPDNSRILTAHMGHDEPPYDADNPILRDGQPVVEPTYLTDALTRESVGFIRRNRSRPFLLYVAYNAVHSPLQATKAYVDRFRRIDDIHRRIFAAMLANLDDSVGEILSTLRKEGLDESTLVFFLSDNGGPTRELTSSNDPLRGGKGDVYEGGIRVPFLARWKGRLPAGRTYDHPVISLDLLATAAAIGQASIGTERPIDGVNLLPHLTTHRPSPPHDELYWRMGRKAALRKGNWKLLRNARRNNDWELYDLSNDVAEANDLATTHSNVVQEMSVVWAEWDRQMADPIVPSP